MTQGTRRVWGAILRYLPLLLTLCWLVFIFSNSLKTAEQSSADSSTVQEIVNGIASGIGIQTPISIQTIRKSAHFFEFGVLSLLVCADILVLYSPKKNTSRSPLLYLCSVPVCALCASGDELLQNFSEGRGPSVSDVLIDTAGAAVATLIFMAVYITVCAVKKKKALKK